MPPPTLDKRGSNVDWIDVVGSDWYDEFTVEELDDNGDSLGPLDLTGCTITANVGEIDFAVTVISAADGQFSLKVARGTTAAAEPAKYPWRCRIVDADDIMVRWMYGTFTVVPAEVDT